MFIPVFVILLFSVTVFIYVYVELRTFALIVSPHPNCARNSHAKSCIERALYVVKWKTIGKIPIASGKDLPGEKTRITWEERLYSGLDNTTAT